MIRTVAAALVLSALLASCATGTTAEPPAAPDPAVTARVITDQIVNWPAGHLGRLSAAESPDGTAASAVTLTSATIDGQGRFNLTLPGGDQLAPYMNRYQITPREDCTTHFTSSVPTATHYTLSRAVPSGAPERRGLHDRGRRIHRAGTSARSEERRHSAWGGRAQDHRDQPRGPRAAWIRRVLGRGARCKIPNEEGTGITTGSPPQEGR